MWPRGSKNPWEPQHDEWKVQGIPDPVHHSPGLVTGIAFDAQTRTLFVIAPRLQPGGQEWYPLVYGYRIKQSVNICDINKDGYVDVEDLLYFVDAFGSVTGDPNYDSRCDFNSDNSRRCRGPVDLRRELRDVILTLPGW